MSTQAQPIIVPAHARCDGKASLLSALQLACRLVVALSWLEFLEHLPQCQLGHLASSSVRDLRDDL